MRADSLGELFQSDYPASEDDASVVLAGGVLPPFWTMDDLIKRGLIAAPVAGGAAAALTPGQAEAAPGPPRIGRPADLPLIYGRDVPQVLRRNTVLATDHYSPRSIVDTYLAKHGGDRDAATAQMQRVLALSDPHPQTDALRQAIQSLQVPAPRGQDLLPRGGPSGIDKLLGGGVLGAAALAPDQAEGAPFRPPTPALPDQSVGAYAMGALAALDAYRGEYPDWVRGSHEAEGPPTPAEYAPATFNQRFPEQPLPNAIPPVADALASFPRALLGGLSHSLSAGGQAAQLEMGQPVDVPSADETRDILEHNVTGRLPVPQGRAGEYSAAVGEVMGNPANWVGPGGLLYKAAWNAAAGLGSEAAGQLYKGTPYEQAARFVGSWSPMAAERAVALAPRVPQLLDRGLELMPQGSLGMAGGRLRQPTFEPNPRAVIGGNSPPPDVPSPVPMVRPPAPVGPAPNAYRTMASPEEIARAASESRKGVTQPELRNIYSELGLTGKEPLPLVQPSLAQQQPPADVARAIELKLADRAVLAKLTKAQREVYKDAGKLPEGMELPSREAVAAQTEQFAKIKAQVTKAEAAFDAQREAGNRMGDLFDLSPATLKQVPNVAQFPLPRVAPQKTEDIEAASRGGLGRLESAARQAPEENWGWYNLMQARDIFHGLHGPERGEQAFQTWVHSLAGTSMVNPIDSNVRASTYYLQQALRGNPLPQVVPVNDPTSKKPLFTLAGAPPPGYGAKAQVQHAARVRQYFEDQYDPVANPKPISYLNNLSGNWMPRTVDTHDIRNALGLYAKEGEKIPEMGLLPKEYSYLEELGGRAAKRAGTLQAPQQAATWIGGGERTGLSSYPAPLLEVINRRAHVTAAVRGITPQQALEEAFRGVRPLLGLGGAAVLGELAAQDQSGASQ